MTHINASRIKQAASSSGTADFGLGSAAVGYRGYAAKLGAGDTAFYTAENPLDPTEWETGIGTMNGSLALLERTTVIDGSAGGSKVNFTNNPILWCGLPGEKVDERDRFLVGKVSASATTLDFTSADADLTVWDEIQISAAAVMGTDNIGLALQFSVDDGGSFDTTAGNYLSTSFFTSDHSMTSNGFFNTAGLGTLNSRATSALVPIVATFTLQRPGDTTFDRICKSEYTVQQDSDGFVYRVTSHCRYTGNVGSAINGLRITSAGAWADLSVGIRGRLLY